MNRRRSIWVFIVAVFGILILITGLYIFVVAANSKVAHDAGWTGLTFPLEFLIGLPVFFGVCILIILIFILAAGFASLNLSDPRQPLGLPEGSVPALIAVMLIVVWIILSIFLIDIFNALPPNDNIVRLGQQLFTTMGTLVVAISAFYFGTSRVPAARSVTAPLPPVIRKIDPHKGKQGESELPLTILGKNFRSPKTVRLAQGLEEMVAIGILSNDAEIHCKINIKADQKLGAWDLIVVNGDGSEDQLTRAFEVTES